MNADTEVEKDNFWFYVGTLAVLLITVVLMVKQTETEKFVPIKELVNEELNSMNIRVLKNYE